MIKIDKSRILHFGTGQDAKKTKFQLWTFCVLLCCALSRSVMTNSLQLQWLLPSRTLCHRNFQARILEQVAISSFRGSSQPTQGSNPCLFHLLHWQVDSLPSCHLGSPYALLVSLYFKYLNEERALYGTTAVIGFLLLSWATDAFGSWMKPTATFSEW